MQQQSEWYGRVQGGFVGNPGPEVSQLLGSEVEERGRLTPNEGILSRGEHLTALEASIHEEWKPCRGMIVASSPHVDT